MSYIIFKGMDFHVFHGRVFNDLEPADWTRINVLSASFEKKTCKAIYKCRRWAVDVVMREKLKEYADGLQATSNS